MDMKFYMMVGLPGSGKSTRAIEIMKAEKSPCVTLSSDRYRERLFGDINDQTHNELVFKYMHNDTISFLTNGVSVVYDATNTTLNNRSKILKDIETIPCTKIAVVVAPNVNICIEQDAKRERTVGKEVIYKFLSSFQFPQKFEGFDMIWLNGWKDNPTDTPNFDADGYINLGIRMQQFDQLNPHHRYALGEHCYNVASLYLEREKEGLNYDIEMTAGLLHDVGKLFTQKIDDNGVAHYYNHDSVGTYYLASHPEIVHTCGDWDNFFETLFYVNYHMRAHRDFKAPKAEKKYRKIFGDDRYERLMQFGEADRIASGTYEGEHE